MLAVFILGVLVGLDNLQVGAALGLAGLHARRRWIAAGTFALCETVMPLIGLAAGQGVRTFTGTAANMVGIGALLLCGALILLMAHLGEDAAFVVDRPATLVALPISLSLDNLVAGAGLGSLGYPIVASALVIGAVSAGLCALGLFGGGRIHRVAPQRAEVLSGVFLIVLAAFRLYEVLP